VAFGSTDRYARLTDRHFVLVGRPARQAHLGTPARNCGEQRENSRQPACLPRDPLPGDVE
jgi:hypothetical protein